jgi:perosamine synthetase
LAERLRLLRNLGFTKPRFRHEVAGFNFRMTGLQAAIGLAQFERIEEIIQRKRKVAATYNRLLADTPGLRLPVELDWARNVYWMYAVVIESGFGATRDEAAEYLHSAGIETRTFFCPMNQQPCLLERPGARSAPCPVADRLWETGFYLPSSPNLTEATIERVCATLKMAAKRPAAAAAR